MEILDPTLHDKTTWDRMTRKRAIDPMVLSYLLGDAMSEPGDEAEQG